MVIISSPAEDSAHWTLRLLKEKPSYLLNMSFDMVCADCNQLSLEKMRNCTHQYKRGSRLQSIKKRKELSKNGFDQEQSIREMYGHLIEESTVAYKDYLLDQFFASPVTETEGIEYITVYIDPNAYGRCNTAFCAITRIKHVFAVIGLDAKNTIDDDEFFAFMLENIIKCSQCFRSDVRRIPIFIAFECNSNRDGAWLKERLAWSQEPHLINCIVIGDPQNDAKVGVYLNGKRPRKMYELTHTLMSVNALKFHSKMTTLNREGPASAQNQLRYELMNYRDYSMGLSANFNQDGKRKKQKLLTGKDTGMQQDDRVIVLQGGAFWQQTLKEDIFYKHLMDKFHIR